MGDQALVKNRGRNRKKEKNKNKRRKKKSKKTDSLEVKYISLKNSFIMKVEQILHR